MAAQINVAEAGEDIVIARAGKPVARLVPVAEATERKPGLRRAWKIPSDVFLEPMDPKDLDAAEDKYSDDLDGRAGGDRGRTKSSACERLLRL